MKLMNDYFNAMKKAGLSLALFAFISVVLVAITNHLTFDRIKSNQADMLLQALSEILPPSEYDNDIIQSKIILSEKETGFSKDTPVYLATKNGKSVTAIFEVVTLKGYNGLIKILIGINQKDASISGVRIVQHNETPGLGDKMDIRKSNWVLAFNHKSLNNPQVNKWQVKKDGGEFDQFTGATITPRAIVNAVKSTLLYAKDNMEHLFQRAQDTQGKKQ